MPFDIIWNNQRIKIIRGKKVVYDTNVGTKEALKKAKKRLKDNGYSSLSVKRKNRWEIYRIID